jgi:hypothetical protein
MRALLPTLLLGLLATTPVLAADTPPSEESIHRLMTVTESHKVLDNALASFDSTVDMSIKQNLAGKQITPEMQAVIDEMRGKMVTVFKDALAWKDMEPIFIQVYQRSLTQEEVNGMIRFYESDAGKAVVRKLPLIMQNTTQLMQERMKAVFPKIAEIQKETMEKVKAAAAAK